MTLEERLQRKWAIMKELPVLRPGQHYTGKDLERYNEAVSLVQIPSTSDAKFRERNQMTRDEYHKMVL